MSFRYLDLSGGGRHLSVTNMAQVSPNVAGIGNTQGAITFGSGPTQPGIYYADTTGFFAPVWGSGDEALSFVIAFNHQNSGGNMLFSWSNPANPSYYTMYIWTNASKLGMWYGNAAANGGYLGADTTSTVATGNILAHFEMRTGATRQINIWVNNVALGLTYNANLNGSPWVPSGNELVQALSRPDGLGNTTSPVGLIGFKRGRFSNAERVAHLQALNAA